MLKMKDAATVITGCGTARHWVQNGGKAALADVAQEVVL